MKSSQLCIGRALFLSLACFFMSASAATYTWTGAQSSIWENPKNWSPEGLPTAGDTAVISGVTLTLNSPEALATLTISNCTINGASLSANSVSASGTNTINSILTSVSTFAVQNGITTLNGGTITDGNYIIASGTLIVNGAFTFSGASKIGGAGNVTFITNQSIVAGQYNVSGTTDVESIALFNSSSDTWNINPETNVGRIGKCYSFQFACIDERNRERRSPKQSRKYQS